MHRDATAHEVVLGRAEDAVDYVDYCAARGETPMFLEPGPDVELTPDGLAAWMSAEAVRSDEVGSVRSFRDAFQVHADLLRQALALPSRSADAARCLTDKALFKTHPAVRPHVADFVEVGLDAGFDDFRQCVRERLTYPVVLKPSNGFYSAGVVRVDSDDQLRRAWTAVRRVCSVLAQSRGGSCIHAESYLAGAEIMADGFVVDGVVRPLLHHVKLPELNGIPTFHETGCVTQPFDPAQHGEMTDILAAVVAGVGLDNSAFNAEFRYDADGVLHLLEIGPRLSGGGASVQNLLRICTGLDGYAIERMLLSPGRGHVDLELEHSACALEYDFCATQNGYLTDTSGLISRLDDLDYDNLLIYRRDGDYVFAPPMNVETIMTAFFRRNSTAEAEDLLDEIIRSCAIRTTATHA